MLITNTHAPAGHESNDRDESRLLSQQLTERVVGVPTEHVASLDELYRRLHEDFNMLEIGRAHV